MPVGPNELFPESKTFDTETPKRNYLTPEEARFEAEKVMEDWSKKNLTKAKMKQAIESALNKQKTSIIAKLIGFNNRWGEWEVDHCNGRQSAVTQWIKDHASVQVEAWLKENFEALPKPDKNVLKAFNKEYQEVYVRELRSHIKEIASQQARNDAINIVKEVTGSEVDYPEEDRRRY